MPYVRDSFWRGRDFGSLADMQTAALVWCREVAGRSACRPLDGRGRGGWSAWSSVRMQAFVTAHADWLTVVRLPDVTTNPTIFHKAITTGDVYDEQIGHLAALSATAPAPARLVPEPSARHRRNTSYPRRRPPTGK